MLVLMAGDHISSPFPNGTTYTFSRDESLQEAGCPRQFKPRVIRSRLTLEGSRDNMTVFRFCVTLMGIRMVNRIIEAEEDCTLEDLHETIYRAFDRNESHLYSFFITGEDTQSFRKIRDATEITHPDFCDDDFGSGASRESAAQVTLGDLDLEEGEVFHYLFDFGDEWWHRIRVDAVAEDKQGTNRIKTVKSIGESPPQYEPFDE